MNAEVLISKTATIQDLYASFGKGDLQAILDHLSEDIQWDARNPFLPQPHVYKGKKEVLEFFKTVGESMNITVFAPMNFYESGNTLYVNGHFELLDLRNNNRPAKIDWTMRWKFKGDKLTHFTEYFAPAE